MRDQNIKGSVIYSKERQ